MKQTTFASLAWNGKGRTTSRERFLAEMNVVVPWERPTALIAPRVHAIAWALLNRRANPA